MLAAAPFRTVALFAFALVGCGSALCDESCESEGRCGVRTFRAGDGAYACYARSDDDCAASDVCRAEGRCFASEQGVCRAADGVSADRCAGSVACSRRGQCGSRSGVCWADSDADCAASFECRTRGRCRAAGGVCVPRTDADCAPSTGCQVEGLCAYFSYLGMTAECRVPLDDAAACERSWVCKHLGRCAPAGPEGCEDCRYAYCARPGEPGVTPCTPHAHNQPACLPHGRCARDDAGQCVAAIDAPASPGPPSQPPPSQPPPPAPSAVAPTPSAAPPVGSPVVDTTPPEPPPGPGAVAYDFPDLFGHPYEGRLMHASLLAGIVGLDGPGAVETLVLRTMPEDTCRPRSRRGLLPLDAIWFMSDFPDEVGTHRVVGGLRRGQLRGKTWLWDGRTGRSHNLAFHGTIVVESRTATEVRGRVELRATEYFQDDTVGTVSGPFVAQIIDCSDYDGGWPM
ncbi:MAG: hypothetical protein RLO52_21320 [Sandaracinaceae bacterium]